MRRLLAAAIVLILCAGCDRGPVIYRVHGVVTTESGSPAPVGMIYFDPELNREDGVQGYAYVKDGTFDTADEGRGVSGGKYVARVIVYNGQARGEKVMGDALGPEESFPIDFPNAESEQKLHLKGS